MTVSLHIRQLTTVALLVAVLIGAVFGPDRPADPVTAFADGVQSPKSKVQSQLEAQAATAATARVVELVNGERGKQGLRSLSAQAALTASAQSYSLVLMTGACFAHTCGPVPNFQDRAAAAGYTGWKAIGENIAAGQRTPEEVVAGWMASSGHRANMLNPGFTEIGVGLTTGGAYGTYWVQMFGARDVPAGGSQFKAFVPGVTRAG